MFGFILINVLPLPLSGLSGIEVLGIRFDHVLHGLVFFVIGFLYVQSRSDHPRGVGVYVTIPLILLLAIGAEALHYVIPWRSFNWNDMTGNVIGVLAGIAVGWLSKR